MILKEYIDKFTKILSYYEISQSDIYDITRAISFAESFGTHPIRLKDLAVSGVDYFANITSDRKDAKPLPDTRLMRVMCDSVTVILFIKKSNIFAKPDVMSIMGMLSNNLSTVLTQANKLMKPDFRGRLNLGKIDHYKTVEECEKVLGVLEETCLFYDFSETFKYTDEVLGKMKLLFDVVDKKHTIFDYKQFNYIYLTDDYDSHGFDTTNKLPSSLKNVTRDCISDFVESWNLFKLFEILVLYISFDKFDENTARYLLTDILVDITEKYSSSIPLGIGGSISSRLGLYSPDKLLVVDSVRNLYNSVFSTNIPLTRNTVDTLLKILFEINKIRG